MDKKKNDTAFESFLNALSWADLMEHASHHFPTDYTIEILLEQEGNYSDYILNLKNIETDESPENLKDQVLAALVEAEEAVIMDLLVNMSPEELIIRHLVESTDEEAREEMLQDQKDWEGGN